MLDERSRSYKIVYEEAIRALDLQRAVFEALRSRIGLLLSASTVATSFLGGLALRTTSDVGGWIAIGLFVGFGAVALRLLWPRSEGAEGFSVAPSLVLEEYVEADEPASLPELLRNLALYAEDAYDENREHHLEPMMRWFRLAIVLLTAEIAAWVVDLAVR